MSAADRRPSHPSYRRHRRQVTSQILLPVLAAAVLLIVAVYLLTAGAFRGDADVGRWAAISTIWLSIPFIFGGAILLAVVIAAAYLVSRLAGFIPPFTRQAQLFTARAAAAARRAGLFARRPTLIFPEVGKRIRRAFNDRRGGRRRLPEEGRPHP